jgi:hypothetical protein
MADSASNAPESQRMTLDTLVSQLRDPTFAERHRRAPNLRFTSDHVNPVMLAVSSRDSLYVRSWRDHAKRCDACRGVFAYFKLPVE